MEGIMRISDMCTDFAYQKSDQVSVKNGVPLSDCRLKTAPSYDVDSGGESSDLSDMRILQRQFFRQEETFTMFNIIKSKAIAVGTLTWDDDEKACLYETTVDASGIQIWKYRKCESIEEGQKTRVTEQVKGSCPSWMKFIVNSQASKGHRAHMDKYPLLFE